MPQELTVGKVEDPKRKKSFNCRCCYCDKNIRMYFGELKTKKHKFCSRKCYNQYQSIHLRNINHWRFSKIIKICPICNKKFSDSKVHSYSRLCCSRICLGKYYEEKLKGKNNPNWKNESWKQRRRAYRTIRIPHHPHCNKAGKVWFHRFVMETELERLLNPKEIVHHINKNVKDNRPENLMVFKDNGEHIRYEFSHRKVLHG